jgi:hypothetical protein
MSFLACVFHPTCESRQSLDSKYDKIVPRITGPPSLLERKEGLDKF